MTLHTSKNPFLALGLAAGVIVLGGGAGALAAHASPAKAAHVGAVAPATPFDAQQWGYCLDVFYNPKAPQTLTSVVLYAPPKPKAGFAPSCPSGNYASLAPTNGETQGG